MPRSPNLILEKIAKRFSRIRLGLPSMSCSGTQQGLVPQCLPLHPSSHLIWQLILSDNNPTPINNAITNQHVSPLHGGIGTLQSRLSLISKKDAVQRIPNTCDQKHPSKSSSYMFYHVYSLFETSFTIRTRSSSSTNSISIRFLPRTLRILTPVFKAPFNARAARLYVCGRGVRTGGALCP